MKLTKVIALALSVSFTLITQAEKSVAQTCGPPSNVSFNFISPPQVDIMDRESARWSVDAGIRFGFTGDWCPIEEDVSFEDEDGNAIPAVLYFHVQTQLVDNGPIPPQTVVLKPLMSLEPSTDYTLILSPPNPALATYSDYTLQFRTARTSLEVDYDAFQGISEVEIDGDLCQGEGLFIGDPENLDCIVPSFLQLRATFKPLAHHEVAYRLYRISSIPNDPDAGLDLIDEVERPLAFIPGVSAERAERSVDVSFPVLYAPFPREECYKVVAVDEWGRERTGHDIETCINLDKPSACADAQFPEPNPFENTPPIETLVCETLGINGASPNTAIPEVEENELMEEEELGESNEVDMEEDGVDGCQQNSNSLDLLSLLLFLLGATQLAKRSGRFWPIPF